MGLGIAFAFTPWYGLFSHHIDRSHENFEWGLAISFSGFAVGIASLFTGILADKNGFPIVFVLGGVLSLIATLVLFLMRKNIVVKVEKGIYKISVKKNKK